MANPEPSKAAKRSALLVLVPMGIVLAIIASFATCLLAPRGERLGALDLKAATPTLAIDLRPGDKLNFRLAATVGTATGYPDSSRSRNNAVHDQLAMSTITVTLAREGQAEISDRCRAYDGKAATSSTNEHDVETSGLPLRCSLVAKSAGKHEIGASVVWTPADVRKAKLEVHREREGD